MTLTMADGPPSNLPPGFDAYAGYVNVSGIGQTFAAVVAKYPNALHLSITTNGSPAMCADVEKGAMQDWTGYDYGYCAVSSVNQLIKTFGRPRKLWTAHYDPAIGEHICSPECWPGLVTTADGTQWTSGSYDQSVLADDFFDLAPPVPVPLPEGIENMPSSIVTIGGAEYLVTNVLVGGHWKQVRQTVASLGQPSTSANTSIIDLTVAWPQELTGVTA